MDVREKLKAWRGERDISQADAAKLAGFTQAAWCSYESGRVPVTGHALRIQEVTAGSPNHVRVEDWMPLIQEQRKARRRRSNVNRSHGDSR